MMPYAWLHLAELARPELIFSFYLWQMCQVRVMGESEDPNAGGKRVNNNDKQNKQKLPLRGKTDWQTGQGKAGQGRAGQGRAGLDRAGHKT